MNVFNGLLIHEEIINYHIIVIDGSDGIRLFDWQISKEHTENQQ
jgi:hypothetical protein